MTIRGMTADEAFALRLEMLRMADGDLEQANELYLWVLGVPAAPSHPDDEGKLVAVSGRAALKEWVTTPGGMEWAR